MPTRISEGTRARLRWAVPLTFLALAAGLTLVGVLLDIDAITLLGFLAGVFWLFFTLDALGLTKEKLLVPREPAEDRVKHLVEALAETTTVIAEIEREVHARTELADRLQRDVARHSELLELSRSEVEAVAQTLRTEVQRESRRGLWLGIAVNAFFFALGILVTLLVT